MGLVAVQEWAGDEQADVCMAKLPVMGALMEQPGCPQHPDTQPGGCLAWYTARLST